MIGMNSRFAVPLVVPIASLIRLRFRKISWFSYLSWAFAGAILGRLSTTVFGSSDPGLTYKLQVVHRGVVRRVEAARVAAMMLPTWESRDQLLRLLCREREVRISLLCDQGRRLPRPEELAPSSEQMALLHLLRRESKTREQEYRCEGYGFRMFRGLQSAYQPEMNGTPTPE